ncbi:hypothetical protein [Ornithinibacillus halophilus]|uniref:Uncharacterized protein n=1 Tax=Ornithinibacillus halophilus TaxID=930117 RepID=A0A1M5DW77_9BACI|nr:hypothetical protein [Ornithinibacillus halophilus]SHF71243.1 hypothetical protein SAMN05216225_100329 [Ornithinibacillus halophilus]
MTKNLPWVPFVIICCFILVGCSDDEAKKDGLPDTQEADREELRITLPHVNLSNHVGVTTVERDVWC